MTLCPFVGNWLHIITKHAITDGGRGLDYKECGVNYAMPVLGDAH